MTSIRDLLSAICTTTDSNQLRNATQVLTKQVAQPQFANELFEILFAQDQLSLLACIQLKNNASAIQMMPQHRQALLEFIPQIQR